MAGFWAGKRVFLTGHTGFKGAWCAAYLEALGATVFGYALPPIQSPSLWSLIADRLDTSSRLADIRDTTALAAALADARPDIVIHMAAQPIVRESYRNPVETFSTNVMGTVSLLECLRSRTTAKLLLVVTSDKVYWNRNSAERFREDDSLGGVDPYSASKSACEIVVRSYAESFLRPGGMVVATARAGNVVGGGDWSADRLVPDIYRATVTGTPLVLRHPDACRPWQHVMDCLHGYLSYVEALSSGDVIEPSLNFGPGDLQTMTVSRMADALLGELGSGVTWVRDGDVKVHEDATLALDVTRAREVLGWQARLSIEETIRWTARWYGEFSRGADPFGLISGQIDDFVGRTRRRST
jgi:CDP-glucose 4,6-dehydratase